MPSGIQISTFLIPRGVWNEGHHGERKGENLFVQAPARIAQDARDIERRAFQKRLNLQNESRRYALCCERLQQTVVELLAAGAPLPPPVVWPKFGSSGTTAPTASALLAYSGFAQAATEAALRRQQGGQKIPTVRIASVFVPPDGARLHLNSLLLSEQLIGPKLFDDAAQRACKNHPDSPLSGDCIRLAYSRRCKLATECLEDFGLVDVIEMV